MAAVALRVKGARFAPSIALCRAGQAEAKLFAAGLVEDGTVGDDTFSSFSAKVTFAAAAECEPLF
jgi:hypothetical protein